MRLDMRQHVHGVVAQLVDPLRQLPGELFVGGIQGEVSRAWIRSATASACGGQSARGGMRAW